METRMNTACPGALENASAAELAMPDCRPLRRDRNVIINTERHAKAVEARAQIGCARRDADGDLLHEWSDPRAKREAIVTSPA